MKTEYNNNAHLPLDNFVVKCIMYKVIELQKPVWTATGGVSAEAAPFLLFGGFIKCQSLFLLTHNRLTNLKMRL